MKRAESQDLSQGTIFVESEGTTFEERAIPFPLLKDMDNNKENRKKLPK